MRQTTASSNLSILPPAAAASFEKQKDDGMLPIRDQGWSLRGRVFRSTPPSIPFTLDCPLYRLAPPL
ncbi:unnamed protein product [Linum trigynum]|uniref:Uncharacterized protein n=1 Tax=Linum trigynum TaxID=586398 RepID=A0AAV2GAY1_9ROSI